jgi:hypothetical protein
MRSGRFVAPTTRSVSAAATQNLPSQGPATRRLETRNGEGMGTSTRRRWWLLGIPAVVLVGGTISAATGPAGAATSTPTHAHIDCASARAFCTEVHDSEDVFGEGVYVGHDEPSVLFYDGHQGAGNNQTYLMRLPKEPPTLPNQQGTGGTFNFQLHPAFWLGMAMCDTESAPEYTHTCTADSDSNIFDATSPADAHYIGKHPGAAFMEMQFYPPGYVLWPPGNSCDATKWCAALNVDSLSEDQNTLTLNNHDCLSKVGIEPVNFAFLTRSGVAHAPADPLLSTNDTFTPNPATDLFMNSGDQLVVAMHDTSAGFRVDITDQTSGQTGSMTASVANQFGQVIFDPSASTCSSRPYAFHPMYGSSSEHTRVPWAAHGYNVAFSDEIGHFEYCAAVTGEGGTCTSPGTQDNDGIDRDDHYCFSGATSSLVQVGGCLGSETDFDGSAYLPDWPGTSSPNHDASLHPQSILFTSPRFNGNTRYSRMAFEADLPRIEAADFIDPRFPACNRTTGANCVNPPPGAAFYPIYTTRNGANDCQWQLGGTSIPGTTETFGGTSTAEFGPLLLLGYPSPAGIVFRYNNFRRVLAHNPC